MAGSYRKVFRFRFHAICSKCHAIIDFNKESISKSEKMIGKIPFSLKSASGLVICPECGGNEMTVHYEYATLYRKRCVTCGEMFEDDNTWNFEHESCMRERIKYLEIVKKPEKIETRSK